MRRSSLPKLKAALLHLHPGSDSSLLTDHSIALTLAKSISESSARQSRSCARISLPASRQLHYSSSQYLQPSAASVDSQPQRIWQTLQSRGAKKSTPVRGLGCQNNVCKKTRADQLGQSPGLLKQRAMELSSRTWTWKARRSRPARSDAQSQSAPASSLIRSWRAEPWQQALSACKAYSPLYGLAEPLQVPPTQIQPQLPRV